MNYKYCENDNYEDFACGRVLIHRGGYPNFPVRLAQEIFGRCINHLGKTADLCLYDPCCGGGYLLTVLGLLNPGAIKTLYGSDISGAALELAEDNLALLTHEGMDKRIIGLERLYSLYKKESHAQAAESARRLKSLLPEREIDAVTFQNDIFNSASLSARQLAADIVFFDVPYGRLVQWQGGGTNILDNLLPSLNKNAVIAVCSNKSQQFGSSRFKRLEKQQIGKRQFQLFTPL